MVELCCQRFTHIFIRDPFECVRDVSEEYFSVTVGRQAIKMFPLAHAFVIILVKIHRVGRCFDRKNERDTDCEEEGRDSKVELL